MCSLFGLIDSHNILTQRQKQKIIRELSRECECRGTDATGIAYNSNGLRIDKYPLPAHQVRFRIPCYARVIMGHTRAATQGNAAKPQNNHPFPGACGKNKFALAHNGIITNDFHLRKTLELPRTNVETDSYVAVQLLEQNGSLYPQAIAKTMELLEGSFTFTILDQQDNLYFVKGNNPLCIISYPSGVLLYASTEDILMHAVAKLTFLGRSKEKVSIASGEIVTCHCNGEMERNSFNSARLYHGCWNAWSPQRSYQHFSRKHENEMLYQSAANMGIMREEVDELLDYGITPDEIEALLYDQPLLRAYLDELYFSEYLY